MAGNTHRNDKKDYCIKSTLISFDNLDFNLIKFGSLKGVFHLHISRKSNLLSIEFYEIVKQPVESRLKVKICWYHGLYADVISFFITKRCQKVQTINENLQYWRRKCLYPPNDIKNFNKILRKRVTYDNFKSHKKAGLQPLSRK